VHPARHTHDMIRFSEEFAINVPGRDLIHHVQYLGSVSGKELDKFDVTKLPTLRARKVEAPLIEGCVGYIECGLEDALRIGDHTLFVGRVVAASADDEAFAETWLLTTSRCTTSASTATLSWAARWRRASPSRPRRRRRSWRRRWSSSSR